MGEKNIMKFQRNKVHKCVVFHWKNIKRKFQSNIRQNSLREFRKNINRKFHL